MTNCHTWLYSLQWVQKWIQKCILAFGKVVFLPILFLFAYTASDTWAQESAPEFSVDIVSARSDEARTLSRVDVYSRISYTSLSFISTPNGFTASYEMSLSAVEVNENNRLRNIVRSPIWDGNIVVDTYVQTQSDEKADFTTQSFDLTPGRYVFEFELTDKNSNQVYIREVLVTVRNFDAPTTISDLTLLESYDSETLTIIPRVDRTVFTSDGGIKVFYEVYSEVAQDVTVRREVFRTVRDGGIPAVPAWLELGSGEGNTSETILFEEELTQLPAGKSQHLVRIPIEDFKAGGYLVRISLLGADGEILDTTGKAFVSLWSGLAAHILDIDDAISQLEYYAKKKDLNFIKEGSDKVERFQRFQSFWERRDPTPNTKRNERMEEYYYRIAFTNRKYGAVQDGWKTDRGYVYVTFGEPDFVQNRPFNFDYEPYEVWIYERIGRRFIFIDKTGFGDYELLVPVWNERTRLY